MNQRKVNDLVEVPVQKVKINANRKEIVQPPLVEIKSKAQLPLLSAQNANNLQNQKNSRIKKAKTSTALSAMKSAFYLLVVTTVSLIVFIVSGVCGISMFEDQSQIDKSKMDEIAKKYEPNLELLEKKGTELISPVEKTNDSQKQTVNTNEKQKEVKNAQTLNVGKQNYPSTPANTPQRSSNSYSWDYFKKGKEQKAKTIAMEQTAHTSREWSDINSNWSRAANYFSYVKSDEPNYYTAQNEKKYCEMKSKLAYEKYQWASKNERKREEIEEKARKKQVERESLERYLETCKNN